MKAIKWLAVWLMLALPAAGIAEEYVTLAQLREQSAAGWHQTEAERDVMVDADVLFHPERETCPIVEVESLIADVDDSLFDVYRDIMADEECGVYHFPGSMTVQLLNWRTVYPQGLAELVKGNYVCVQDEYLNGETPETQPENVDLDYEGFLERINQDLTRLVGLTLDDFFIDRVAVSQPLSDAKLVDGKKVSKNSHDPRARGKSREKMGQYTLSATQSVCGMPILKGLWDVGDGVPDGHLVYGYRNPKYFYFTFACSKATNVRAEDVPLLSFDAFKAKMEAHIAEGKLRSVTEMEFGMLVCRDGEKWVLAPVWRIRGEFTKNPKKERAKDYVYDFNAQTGELMETMNRDGARPVNLPKILTWDDVK